METVVVVKMLQPSEEQTGLVHRNNIADGYSKGFAAVRNAGQLPYGEERPVTKEECIGHVHKWVGSKLRTLKKDLKGKKLSGGDGIHGGERFTDSICMIDHLRTYYNY